jgi:hypothetical protein
VANQDSHSYSILINRSGEAEATVSADLTCIPSTGTLPFSTRMTLTVENLYTGQYRQLAARLNVTMADGQTINNWRRGFASIAPGSSLVADWYQGIPGLVSLVGDNIFTLEAEDVTPAPYNQPPYPPAGDADTGNCTVSGVAP